MPTTRSIFLHPSYLRPDAVRLHDDYGTVTRTVEARLFSQRPKCAPHRSKVDLLAPTALGHNPGDRAQRNRIQSTRLVASAPSPRKSPPRSTCTAEKRGFARYKTETYEVNFPQ